MDHGPSLGRRLLLGLIPVVACLISTAHVRAQEVRLIDVLEGHWEENPAAPLLPASFLAEETAEVSSDISTPAAAPQACDPSGSLCGPASTACDAACGDGCKDRLLDWHNPFLTWSDCWVIPRGRHGEYCRRQRAFQQETPVCADEYEQIGCGHHAGGGVCCVLQRRFVNFRPAAQYLEGCLPAGFYMLPFIRSVPHMDYHSAPLNPDQAIESAEVNTLEARTADGTEFKPISAVSTDITLPTGELPKDVAKETFATIAPRMHLPGTGRNWCAVTFQWNASLLSYAPLYFEDVNVERYGYTWGLAQPVVSGTKFLGTVVMLPYLITAQPPHTMQYDLGNARPGSPTPYVHQLPPPSTPGAIVEAVTITGLILLIP